MEIKRSGSQPSGKGPAENFTGTVRRDPLFQANGTTKQHRWDENSGSVSVELTLEDLRDIHAAAPSMMARYSEKPEKMTGL
jgi:hypothetical protein